MFGNFFFKATKSENSNAKKRNKLRRILNYVKSLEKEKRIYIDSPISCLKTCLNPVFIVHS